MEVKFTNKVKAQIIEDIENGMSVDAMAKKYGTSKLQMTRWVGKMRLKLDGGLPEGTVRCTQNVMRTCYYGDTQGRCCNYIDIEGHSRIIKSVSKNGAVEYHNLTSSCSCFKAGTPRGLVGVVD